MMLKKAQISLISQPNKIHSINTGTSNSFDFNTHDMAKFINGLHISGTCPELTVIIITVLN